MGATIASWPTRELPYLYVSISGQFILLEFLHLVRTHFFELFFRCTLLLTMEDEMKELSEDDGPGHGEAPIRRSGA